MNPESISSTISSRKVEADQHLAALANKAEKQRVHVQVLSHHQPEAKPLDGFATSI
jgi:hypothetical protein